MYQTMIKKLKIIKFTFILLFYNCSFIISLNDLPEPSGTLNVGTEIYYWTDESREEWFTEEVGDKRKIVAQIWYPTTSCSDESVYSYVDDPKLRIKAIAKRLDIPKILLSDLKNVNSNACLNAPIMKNNYGKFPLVIFSHGLGGMKVQNSIQIEDLVSNGYIVIAPDHAYDANITIFEDKSTADFKSGYPSSNVNITPEQFWKVRLPQINTRAADIDYIINKIKQESINNGIFQHVDLDNVGIFGHSYGGATSIVSSFNNKEIKACLALDGWMLPVQDKIINSGINIPFMYIGQSFWPNDTLNYNILNKFTNNNNDFNETILLEDTKHYDFSDTPHLSKISKKIGLSGSMNTQSLLDTVNYKVRTFFNSHLSNNRKNN